MPKQDGVNSGCRSEPPYRRRSAWRSRQSRRQRSHCVSIVSCRSASSSNPSSSSDVRFSDDTVSVTPSSSVVADSREARSRASARPMVSSSSRRCRVCKRIARFTGAVNRPSVACALAVGPWTGSISSMPSSNRAIAASLPSMWSCSASTRSIASGTHDSTVTVSPPGDDTSRAVDTILSRCVRTGNASLPAIVRNGRGWSFVVVVTVSSVVMGRLESYQIGSPITDQM